MVRVRPGESVGVGAGLFRGAERFFRSADGGLPLAESGARVTGGDGFRRFSTNEEAQRYGDRMWGDAVARLPADQQRAVRRYTLHSWPYTSISRAENPERLFRRLLDQPQLRDDLLELYNGRLPALSEIRADATLLNKAAGRPLSEGVELHRSVSRISFLKDYDGADPRSLVGTFQTTSTPMSTALGDPPYNSFRLHLLAPPGQRGLWIGGSGAGPTRREFLLPGGTVYHIAAVMPGPRDSWNLYGRFLP